MVGEGDFGIDFIQIFGNIIDGEFIKVFHHHWVWASEGLPRLNLSSSYHNLPSLMIER